MNTWHRVWVTATVTLIAFISYSSQIFVVWPFYGRVLSWPLLKLLVPFNLLVGMVFWNYYLCVTTPPGGVPQGWRPNMQSDSHVEVKRGTGAPRYCRNCDHFKPPRSHHCRQCKTCVLKLDHHCPWIANCVGYHNHGHFIRFLLWVDIATSYHLAMMVTKAIDIARSTYDEPTLSDMLFLIFNFAACIPVWCCVGMFSLYHLWLIANNTTTIERWEKDKVATLVRRGKIEEITYPYNLGTLKNMKSVLGSSPLLWLWPQEIEGDGLSYPVNPEAGGESSGAEWAGVVAPDQVSYEATASGQDIAGPSNLQSRLRGHLQSNESMEMLTKPEPDAQYAWPPADPSARPNPGPPRGSAFVYGEGGLNPSLQASSGALRARDRPRRHGPSYVPPWETALNSDGEERGSDDTSSSPEHYLSDYDDEGQAYASAHRVRRGSEGWEIRPAPGWAAGPSVEEQHWADVERAAAMPPWQRPGRYNTYDSDSE